ncbi:patatin-like phospholipase family protein [Vibrio sinaloensis]|uniref:patatin-like phospholipase family protein n=1 Tax=Photobacterium sp. (strain ATCC 43367) TaxID=379097 RepID=UPI0035EE2EE1
MNKFYIEYWAQQNYFPELDLQCFKQGGEYAERDLGIAFAGGGTRSAACTLGQLKALHDLDLIDRVKYISAVSGGGWAAVPYSFTNNLEAYFGKILEPNKITTSLCKHTLPGSLQRAITSSPLIFNLLKGGGKLRGDESFAYALGQVFLKPYDLESRSRYFTFNDETKSAALSGFPNGMSAQFQLSRDGAPFLILGATLLNEDGLNSDKKYHVEYTPYYSGVRVGHTDNDFFSQDDYFGGGYVTSCGYDCRGPYAKLDEGTKSKMLVKQAPQSGLDFTNEKAFSLSDIIASTGAAPQEVTNNIGLGALGFPEFNHIPLNVPDNKLQVTEEYPHSDGGHLENLGVMPLLARKVPTMVVFVNTKKPFVPDMNQPLNSSINKSLKALFMPIDNLFKFGDFDTNVVFKDGKNKLLDVIAQFSAQVDKESSSGEYVANTALIAKSQLTTRKNSHYGIDEDHQVEVIWVYNCRSKEWEDSIAERSLASKLAEKKKWIGNQDGLEDFPHYGTFFENLRGVVELTPLQTNLLTNLSYWVAKKALADLT